MRTNTNDTIFIQVFSCFFAYIRNIGCKFLQTTFSFAYFEQLLNYVNRSEHILTYDTLGKDDSILIVITFPRDIGYFEVFTESKFTVLGSITFGKYLSCFHFISFAHDWVQVNGGILVCLLELRQQIFFLRRIEGDELFVFRSVVFDTNTFCIYIGNNASAFSLYLCTAITDKLSFDTSTYDRRLAGNQRHGLSHHVRSHQCTVGIIVLEERDECCSDRSDL